MQQEELVSIIIPVYNAERFLEETINNIMSQTYENWEAIFVDDCSIDNSFHILEKYEKIDKRIRIYKMNKNVGNPSYPRNFGVQNANGRFLCFIDADDKWDIDKLERQINFMKEKKCAFSYHSYEFANEKCIPNGKKVLAREILTYKQSLKNNIISTITVMFDITKIEKELIKMPNIKYVEDTATWWKILRNGYVAYGITDLFSYYRRIPNTNSSNKFKTQKYLWLLYRNEEKLNIIYSMYCLLLKNINAILRRI